jgi:DNA-binding protein HU-beta
MLLTAFLRSATGFDQALFSPRFRQAGRLLWALHRCTIVLSFLEGSNTLTQTQLVKLLAEDLEVSRKVSKQFLDGLASTAIKEVRKTGAFVLPGIGKLVRVDRKARVGRNPATGETINIPAKKVVKFRVAKAAKEAIVPPKGKKVATG